VYISDPNHGHGGEQSVERDSEFDELREAFLEAGRQLGYPTNDLNSYHINGKNLSPSLL